MVLSDPAKSGLEDGAWIDGYQTKTKTIPNTKNKSPLFFRTVYHSKNHVIPHHFITAILDVILNI